MGPRLAWIWLSLGAVVAIGAEGPGQLVGTWQLVSRVDRDKSGNVVPEPSLGEQPTGYLIYDAKGHVAAQLMKSHRTSNPCEVTAPAVGNNVAQVGGYDAYFGRYEVDWSAGTVTHTLDGALVPADVGRRLSRHFKLEGDSLTIQFEPDGNDNQRVTRTLVWKRVSR
jgi:lipocalin-like protein